MGPMRVKRSWWVGVSRGDGGVRVEGGFCVLRGRLLLGRSAGSRHGDGRLFEVCCGRDQYELLHGGLEFGQAYLSGSGE